MASVFSCRNCCCMSVCSTHTAWQLAHLQDRNTGACCGVVACCRLSGVALEHLWGREQQRKTLLQPPAQGLPLCLASPTRACAAGGGEAAVQLAAASLHWAAPTAVSARRWVGACRVPGPWPRPPLAAGGGRPWPTSRRRPAGQQRRPGRRPLPPRLAVAPISCNPGLAFSRACCVPAAPHLGCGLLAADDGSNQLDVR
jgi:hypothetical protein